MTPERPSFQVSLRPIRNIIDQLERPIAWDDRRPYLHPKYQVPADVSHNRYEDPDPTLGGMEARFVRRLDPNVTLPDGSDFLTWDDQTLYTMTLHVDQAHPGADDRNNGDRETPLRTIQAAARRATPRTRVVIHRGIYRERIIPAHGGTAPDAMICYQAADNEAVVVRGSMIYEGPWSTKTWIKSFGASETSPPTYRIVLPREWFVGCLPFGMPNEQLRIFYRNSWSYDESKLPEAFKDKIRMRRGLVFQDGQRLTQVRRMPDLLDSPGTYWCENDGRTIHIRPIGDLDPVGRQWEFTHLDQLFCPDERGLRFIRIKGITFEHAADEFPVQFKGAVSNAWGDHWIIEDCIVRQCNSVGINLGSEFWHSLDTPGRGFDIVRRCVIEDIGICGLATMGHPCHNLLIESNTFRRIGWHRFEMCWNAAGAKLYTTLNSVVRNNVFEQMLDTSGIYFDLDNANTRITGNIFRNIAAPRGAIFLEMITEPIEIDHNVFDRINTGMLVPGAATGGHAVRAQHTDGTHIHHNLMIDVEGAGVEIFNDRIERTALTRSVLGLGFRIEHNLLIHCKAQIQAFVVGNTIDQNVYANIDSTHPAFRLHQLRTLCDPQLWMTLTGQDRASAFLSATRTANGFELALVPTWVSELCVPGMRVVRLESGILLERQS